MKTTLWVLLFLCASALFAEVLFYDNFNRADGAVGNSWTNIGSATTAIENNAMKITSPNGAGIRRDFTSITSGIFYIQFDWKVVSTDWYADAFPTGLTTHLVIDSAGDMCYDLDGTMSDPVVLTNVGLGVSANVRLKVNLETDVFSIWINNSLVATDVPGVATSSFYRFTFRGMGANTIQYVDNWMIFDENAPTGLTATSGVGEITINWNSPNYTEPVVYRVFRDTVSQPAVFIAEVPGSVSQYTDYTASANIDYFYRISAVQGGLIETAYSSDVQAHLQPQIEILQQTLELNVNSQGSQTINLPIVNNGGYPLNYIVNGSMDQNAPVRSLYFDGIDDGKHVFLNNFGAQQVFTVSMWIKPETTQNAYANIIDCNHSGTYNWVNQRDNLGPLWNWGYTNNLFSLTDNSWQHLAFTANNGVLKTYVNGVLVRELTRPLFNYARTPNLYLGRVGFATGRTFHGWIDDVHISRSVRYSGNFNPHEDIPPDEFTYGYWNFNEQSGAVCYDQSSAHNNAQIIGNVIRSDDVPDLGWFSVDPSIGIIPYGQSQNIGISVSSLIHDFGTYVDTLYVHSDDPISPIIPIVITINVDLTPPESVLGLGVDDVFTDANQIGLYWSANAIADSVVSYKVFRKGRDESTFRQVGIVPGNQLWFIDNQFTGLDSTYVYYQVRAVDWVGNLGPEGDSIIATLERFLAPSNVQIANVNNRDIHLSWSPVTQTISGLPGTPTCYVIYKSQYPSPISDFDFLGVSFAEEYTHQWALYFQPLNRLFYIVTAYGGNMSRMNELMALKNDWKFYEIESILQEDSIDRLNTIIQDY